MRRRLRDDGLDSIEACALTLRLVAKEMEAQEHVAAVARNVVAGRASVTELQKALVELDATTAARSALP